MCGGYLDLKTTTDRRVFLTLSTSNLRADKEPPKPNFLASPLRLSSSHRALHSQAHPGRILLSTFGHWAFSVAGPTVELFTGSSLRSNTDFWQFRKLLKT